MKIIIVASILAFVLVMFSHANAEDGALREASHHAERRRMLALEKIMKDIDDLQVEVVSLRKENIAIKDAMAGILTSGKNLTKEVATLRTVEMSLKKEMVNIKIETAEMKIGTENLERGIASKGVVIDETTNAVKNLQGDVTNFNSMFDCTSDRCTAIGKYFIFPEGVVVGKWNNKCNYGDGILSVDGYGNNCPSGKGSVTLGRQNKASGAYATVTGGARNTASQFYSAVAGGNNNIAANHFSFAAGGNSNKASGSSSTAVGGNLNEASSDDSSKFGMVSYALSHTHSSDYMGNVDAIDKVEQQRRI